MVPHEEPWKPRPGHEVFSAKNAGHLDTRFRRFLYGPDKLAERYVKPGNRVLDFGCGPGFFSREFAKRVGDTGSVIAVDLQEEMLQYPPEKTWAGGTHAQDPDAPVRPGYDRPPP